MRERSKSGGRLHVAERVGHAKAVFRDRAAAGEALLAFLGLQPDPDALVYALPRGGVPVARPIADALGCPLLPVLVRKLPIPVNPEMGFGAVTFDGTIVVNERVREAYEIGYEEVRAIAAGVLDELRRRASAYGEQRLHVDPSGRRALLVDDGLATGYTALAASDMLSQAGAASLVLAVPCAPSSSLKVLAGHVSEAYCLYEQTAPPFAVASFYESFPELTDADVRALLSRA